MSNTVDEFVNKIKANDNRTDAENKAYNEEFAKIKSSLPQNEQAAAETKVRTALNS